MALLPSEPPFTSGAGAAGSGRKRLMTFLFCWVITYIIQTSPSQYLTCFSPHVSMGFQYFPFTLLIKDQEFLPAVVAGSLSPWVTVPSQITSVCFNVLMSICPVHFSSWGLNGSSTAVFPNFSVPTSDRPSPILLHPTVHLTPLTSNQTSRSSILLTFFIYQIHKLSFQLALFTALCFTSQPRQNNPCEAFRHFYCETQGTIITLS